MNFKLLYIKLTFTQIPQPIHNSSEIEAIFVLGVTSIHSFPILTTGQDFLHSCRHLFGLHLSVFTIAILVKRLVSSVDRFGGILSNVPGQYFCRKSKNSLKFVTF